MSATPNYRRGAEAAKEASKGGGNFARTEFFKLDDGEVAILRFLTDAEPEPDGSGGWINVLQHQMIPTKPKPEDYTGNWPERMGCVCRNDEAFIGVYEDCYICDHIVDGNKVKKPGTRTWALACIREEVLGDGSEELGGPSELGKRVGLRDATREVTIPAKEAADGQPARKEEKITEKKIVVVNMGFKNFFGILQAFAAKNGTILDRDFWIRRSGAGLDTQYQIVSEEPIRMENGEVFDLRESKFMDRYKTNLDLIDTITERSDNEFYARFFDPRYSADDKGSIKETGASPEAKPSTEIDADKMANLAARVRNYPSADSENEAGEKAPEPAVPGGGMKDFG